MDIDAKAWLNVTTDQINDTSKWFERDLDDFLKEIHRDQEEEDQAKWDEEEDKIRQILHIEQRKWNQISKMFDEFDSNKE